VKISRTPVEEQQHEQHQLIMGARGRAKTRKTEGDIIMGARGQAKTRKTEGDKAQGHSQATK